MKIIRCTEADFGTLAGIWERSVRATHHFLSDSDFNEIRSVLIPRYFPNVDLYAVVDDDALTGFIGLSTRTIEMLFVDDAFRNMGYGSHLIDFAVGIGAVKVDVNEQNTAALAFYQAKGFHIISRDETDDAGRPYPILHLSL